MQSPADGSTIVFVMCTAYCESMRPAGQLLRVIRRPAEAHEAVEQGHVAGKVVLAIA